MSVIRTAVTSAAVLLFAACGSPEWKWVDDVNGSDLSFRGQAPAGLYPPGGEIRVRLVSSDEEQDFKGWRLESSNPAVLEIDSTGGGEGFVTATLLAKSEGSAVLKVLQKDGKPAQNPQEEVPMEIPLEVKAPDRLELHPAVPLIADRTRNFGPLEQLLISPSADPGKLVIRYFAGDREVRGSHPESFATTQDGNFSVARLSTKTFGRADIVQIGGVTAETTGTLTVAISDTVTKSIPVIPVTDDLLKRAEFIAPPKDSLPEDAQAAVVLAVFDAQDRLVTGVPARFIANGEPLQVSSGEDVIDKGDGVLYKVSGDELTVKAEGPNGLTAETKVRGRNPKLLTQTGCSSIPVASTVLLLLWAGLARRRSTREV